MIEEKTQKNQKPILIYYKTMGRAQIIRCVLYQIEIDFEQIFLNFDGTVQSSISWKQQIDLKKMPYFIHNELKVSGIFPIIKYICKIWNRNDLMGKTIQHHTIIAQMMLRQINNKSVTLNALIKGIHDINQMNLGKQGAHKLKEKVKYIAENEKITAPFKKLFYKNKQFLLGYLSVLDFCYYDRAFYSVNFHTQDMPELKLAFQYMKFFKSTSFFKKNQQRLEGYKIIIPQLAYKSIGVLKQIWLGDPKFISIE